MNSEERIQHIIKLMEADDSIDAPADSVKWAKNIFRTRAAEPKRSVLRRIVAMLQADLAGNKPVFGERSATAAAERQMLYRTDNAAVDIRVKLTGKSKKLSGQVIGEDCENAPVRLIGDSGERVTTTDENAAFEFERIAGGTYDIVLIVGDEEVVIEKIEL